MKLAFFANSDWFMYKFNMAMAMHLKSEGVDVILLAPKGLYSEKIKEFGIPYIEVPLQRSTINPFFEIKLLIWLVILLKRERVDVLHNFTLRCAISGSLAAILSGTSMRINEITGLGYLFTSQSVRKKALRTIILIMLRALMVGKKSTLTVLNDRDYRYFKQLWIYRGVEIVKILGVGVDCNVYTYTPSCKKRQFRVLLPARMLRYKGVIEFVDAAIYIKNLGLNIEFILAGGTDLDNPTAISEECLKQWHRSGMVNWKGHVDKMFELYREVDLVVLPSYREGLPTSLIEAAACGLPLIATSVAGCEDVVHDKKNGFIIPVENSWAIAAAVMSLYNNRLMCTRFGRQSRYIAESNFSQPVIFNQRMCLYGK